MPCYNPGSSEVQISPTFLSTDLLTPAVPRRITFSSLGVFRRSNNVTDWGTEDIKYGGIGKLPILPKASAAAAVKDIVKSRSHRHYSSGVNNYNACTQPYAVTSLSLSGCRINDQLLPAPLNTEHEKIDEPWPGHAYTSHICQFDVFPRFDPERTKFDVLCQRKLKQKLHPATEDALEKLSDSIYRTTVYQDTMKDSTGGPVQIRKGLEDQFITLNKENTSSHEVENWDINDREEIEGKESSEDEDEQDEENLKNGKRKNQKNLTDEDEKSDSRQLSAVWPIWPVGLSNMRKTPLNFPKILLPTYTPQDFVSGRNRLHNKETTENTPRVSEECSLQNDTIRKTNDEKGVKITNRYIPALTAYNSSSLGLGHLKHIKFTNPEHKNLNEVRQVRVGLVPAKHLAGIDYMKLPMIPRERTVAQSHEPLKAKKNCATGMLGVRFKTDAHKRYHEMHSDVIPDLRDSTITGRQHFFWGVHACALR